MQKLPQQLKEKAVSLRKNGYSIQEIATKTGIAKSTASLWLRNIVLNKKAKNRLEERVRIGRQNAALQKKRKKIKEQKRHNKFARGVVKNINRDLNHNKLYCALLYWCEGNKGTREGVRFVNSDPSLVRTFLDIFRKAYKLDEKKFHALMHLHDYHNEQKQKEFWSEVTNIPENQFYRTFYKKNTEKRIKDNYPGCISISYQDLFIAREIKSIYSVFSK